MGFVPRFQPQKPAKVGYKAQRNMESAWSRRGSAGILPAASGILPEAWTQANFPSSALLKTPARCRLMRAGCPRSPSTRRLFSKLCSLGALIRWRPKTYGVAIGYNVVAPSALKNQVAGLVGNGKIGLPLLQDAGATAETSFAFETAAYPNSIGRDAAAWSASFLIGPLYYFGGDLSIFRFSVYFLRSTQPI